MDWDASTSSLSVTLPDISFPLIIAFGLGFKIPDAKGGFNLAFPSFKFGSKGEIEAESDSDSDDNKEKKGKGKAGFGLDIKAPKFGFGGKGDAEGKSVDVPEPTGKFKVSCSLYNSSIFEYTNTRISWVFHRSLSSSPSSSSVLL